MKRFLALFAALWGSTTVAHAFSGEDPIFGHPYYHAQITREAAKQAGFSFNPAKDKPDPPKANIALEIAAMIAGDPSRGADGAAESLGWHADYLDSYLYSPIWWAQGKNKEGDGGPSGILRRYKVSRAVLTELEACHFDDLFTTEKVNAMWRRYASGTFAGLMWAKDHDDLAAAHNVLGASLHAVEDFYSHSSWVDKPARRTATYFEYPVASRYSDNLYTGAYEHDHQLGVKSHGKWIPQQAIWGFPGVKQIMEIACEPISPFSNSDSCEMWREVKEGTSMHPTIGGLKLPDSIMVYTPAGIALDNTWVANEAVKQRGIEISGADAFKAAHGLAIRQAFQWLKTLERAMTKAGPDSKAFWDRLKKFSPSDAQREAQFEDYAQFPFMFMAFGPPPEKATRAEEWFLRVKLHTAEGRTGGTDSDIKLTANGKPFLLDYLHGTSALLTYNDFEAGDNDAYFVGPFDKCPDQITLTNDAADTKEIFKALGNDFVEGVKSAVDFVGNALLSLIAGHADKVKVNKQLWMPENLSVIPKGGSRPFTIDLNGGKEGNYQANGTIVKTGEDANNYQFEVRLDTLKCIKESTWDRGSNSDEPFLLCALNPFPGGQQTWLSPAYEDVDTGETVKVNQRFAAVSIPKSSGMLNLAITLMESDDESQKDREELLEKFAGTYKDKTENANRRFTEALTTTFASSWKLADIEVVAWSRNGRVRQGVVLRDSPQRWIAGKESATFPLNVAGARDTGVSTDDLLPQLPADGKLPAEEQPTAPPEPGAKPTYDISMWGGEWDTTLGRMKLGFSKDPFSGDSLNGRFYETLPGGRLREADQIFLRHNNAEGSVVGVTLNFAGRNTLEAELSLDGNSFTGKVGGLTPWTGKRYVPATAPGKTSTPTTGTISTTPGAGGAGTVTGGNAGGGGGAVGTDGFQNLGAWDIKIESMQLVRGRDVEVAITYRNMADGRGILTAGDVGGLITDADGIGVYSVGNLYMPTTNGRREPQPLRENVTLEADAQAKMLLLFKIPPGAAPLKTLTVFGYRTTPVTTEITGITLPNSKPTLPLAGLVGGTKEFAALNEFGLRLDGVRRGRNGEVEVFVTVKNEDLEKDYVIHPRYNLDVSVIDANGLTRRARGEMYRAVGTALQLIQHNVYILPGGEATTAYSIPMLDGGVAKTLVLIYGGKTLKFDLPAIP